MAQPFIDDFSGEVSTVNAEDHTPSGGTAWTTDYGTASHARVNSSGQFLSNATSGETHIVCDDQGSADQYCEATFDTYYSPYLICRYVDNNNWVGVRTHTSSQLQAYKRVSGSYTKLGSDGSVVSTGDVIRIEVDGTSVDVYLNGSGTPEACGGTYSDNTTETTQGIRVYTNIGVAFSAFEAGALGGGSSTYPVLYYHQSAQAAGGS